MKTPDYLICNIAVACLGGSAASGQLRWVKAVLTGFVLTCFALQFSVVQAQDYVHLGVADGLPNGHVQSFAQDRQGYVWMSTEGGLARYDGFRFTVFDEHGSGLSSNELNTVLADPSGDGLFIATQRDGLCYYHPRENRFDVWREKDGLLYDGITHLVAAGDGGIWMCYYLGGMSHRAPDGTLTHFRPDDIPELTAFNWTIATDGRGTLYLGHTKKGLTMLRVEGGAVRSVRNYRNLPGSDNSLASDDVRSVLVAKDGTVWAGTGNGLSVLNPRTGQFVNYHHNMGDTASLSTNSLQQIVQMRDGSVWIAHKHGGISIVPAQEVRRALSGRMRFVQCRDESSLGTAVNAVFEDVSGNRWIAHANEGVLVKSHLPIPFTILRREEGADPSAGMVDSGKLSHALSHILSLDQSRTLLQDYCNDGDTTWVATIEGLFYEVKGRMEPMSAINGQLALKNISSLAIDRVGRLWLGTFGRGLYVFDRSGRLFFHEEAKPLKIINAVRGDRQGRVWVGTRGGLLCFPDILHPDNHRLFGHDDGLADIFIRAIAEDEDGHLWVSCNKGISTIQTQPSGDIQTASWPIYNYTSRDGLPAEEFQTRAAQIRTDGRLVFSTQNHDVIFSPRNLTRASGPPRLSFSGMTLYSQTGEGKEKSEWHPVPKRLDLAYDQNTFKVSLGIDDAALAMVTESQYRIKGLNGAWHTLEPGQTEFTLFNLPYGNYELCCRSRLHNQAWSSEEIRLPIRIRPPFYLTWWAKLCYVLLLAALFYYLIRQYISRMQTQSKLQLEQERMNFYTNVAHELRTPLTLIVAPLEELIENENDNENENENSSCLAVSPRENNKEKLRLIHRNAQQLLTLVNQMMDVRKAEVSTRQLHLTRGNLASVVAETGLRFKELNRHPDVSFVITTDGDTPDTLFDREAVVTILNNLLSNAVKYTERGEIRLTLQQDSSNAIITVADTGFGIPSASIDHIFDPYTQANGSHQQIGTGLGLALVKRLAELHGGGVSVESEEGKGTTFRVTIEVGIPSVEEVPGDTFRLRDDNNAPAAPLSRRRGAGGEAPSLLIVEDNADIRQYIADAFNSEFTILTAPDGERGLALAEKHIPDVIISDVMMPRMDGNEMVRRLKSDVTTSHIPVILLTAKDSMTDKEEGLESGADAYLTKPFTVKMLRSQMTNLMAARQRLMERLQQHTGTIAESAQAQTDALHLNRLDRDFLEKLDSFIDSHIKEEDLDVPRLTEALGMSQSTLYRKMKSLTGLSTSDYLKKARVRHAAKMLREGCNVSEAAMLCGFNNMSYFSKVFKAETGVLPSEYH